MKCAQRVRILAVLIAGTMPDIALSIVLTAPGPHGVTNVFNPLMLASDASDGITVAIHGFSSNPAAWPNNLVADINAELGGLFPTDWQAASFDWNQDAMGGTSPGRVDELQAQVQGHYLAQQILGLGPAHVHLVGHSLGTRIMESALVKLSQVPNPPDLTATFLDAYTAYNWDMFYGRRAAYAESYFNTGDLPFTEDPMPQALNVDISAIRPAEFNSMNPIQAALLGHSWPPAWYERSVEQFDMSDPPFHGYGYALSTEGGTNSNAHGNFRGQFVSLTEDEAILGQRIVVAQTNPFSTNLGTINIAAHMGATQQGNELILTVPGGANQLAWANVAITTTQPTSIFDFDYDFTSNDSNNDGTLSFRIRDGDLFLAPDQLLYVTRETHQLAGWENTGEISWVSNAGGANNLPAGTYTLSFRLDAATAAQARIRLFGGARLTTSLVPEPTTLALLLTIGAGLLWRGKR